MKEKETLEEAKKQQFKYDNLQDAKEISSRIKVVETLEEAAEIFVNNRFSKQISGDKTYPDIYASKEAIVESHILFSKWQQERIGLMEIELRHTKTLLTSCEKALEDRDKQQENSYSEEEVLEILKMYRNSIIEVNPIDIIYLDKWFDQFKKK
jgi:hypothetical protein